MADKIREAFMAAHEKSCSIIKDYLTSGYVEDFAKMLIYIGKENAEEVLSKMPEELAQQKKSGFYGFNMADEVIHNIQKEELHNCVASYTDSVKDKHCTIIFVTKDDEYKFCIEVRGNHILQEYADHNEKPDKEEQKILDQWHERNGLIKV